MPLSTTLVFSLLAAPLALGSVISSSLAPAPTSFPIASSSFVGPVNSSFVGGTPTSFPVISSTFSRNVSSVNSSSPTSFPVVSSSFVVPTAVPTANPSVITIFPSGVCTYPGAPVETITYVFGPSTVFNNSTIPASAPTAVISSAIATSVIFATPYPNSSVVSSSAIPEPSTVNASVASPTSRPFHYDYPFNSAVLEIVLLPPACGNASYAFPNSTANSTAIPQTSFIFATAIPSSAAVASSMPSSD